MGILGMIATKQQMLKEEMESQKKQTDVRAECEDSIEFADRKILILKPDGKVYDVQYFDLIY
jgi:hypothetical protein